MSTNEKDGEIPEFSADYRGMSPRPQAVTAGPKSAQNKNPSVPGGVSPQPSSAPRREKEDSLSGRESQGKLPQGRPGKQAGEKPKPSRPKGASDSSVLHGGPKQQAVPAGPRQQAVPAEEEIDDFLPPADRGDDGQLLAKWEESGAPEEAAPKKEKRRGKYRYGILVGSIVMLFALVGVGFIAASVGTAIHARVTDDSKLRAYDKFLTVVVAQDPQPFASPDKADPDFVLNASLWQTMTAEGENYTSYDDAGRAIVPLGDVADACRDLFGPDCSLQPKNPTEETFFQYDSSKAQFHVALYSLDSTYEPYTLSESREGDETVLRVGYVPPSDPTRAVSSSVSSAARPTPSKVMEYVLKTDSSSQKQYVYAVRKAA